MDSPKESGMREWIQVSAITVPFCLAYPLLRSLPDTECALLHYDSVKGGSDSSELCRSEEAFFLDLDRVRFPVEMELVTEGEVELGKEARLSLSFSTDGGSRIYPWELATVHTEKIHLLAVDSTLQDYHHVHPRPVASTGVYLFTLTPRRSGPYTIFAEIVPLASRSVVITKSRFHVLGEQLGESDRLPTLSSEVGDYRFKLDLLSGSGLQVDKVNSLRLRVTHRNDAKSVRLEKIMGAYAHMVAFDPAGKGFAHMHPINEGSGVGSNEVQFSFSVRTDLPGLYRIWAQLKANGREIFAPFDVQIGE